MIDKREILEATSSFSLGLPSIVEKDYVLGWILAGINAHEELADSWVFKGGTCLKKCYFETYRFSEDLDFTLRDESHLDEEFLRPAFEEVVAWVAEQSGLNIPPDQLDFDIYDNPRGEPNCQAKSDIAGRSRRLRAVGRRSSSTSQRMRDWCSSLYDAKCFILTATGPKAEYGPIAMHTKRLLAKSSARLENGRGPAIFTM